MNGKRRVTVFDFDGTLVADDSFIGFSRYIFGSGRFVLGMIRALPWLMAWKAGLTSGSKAKEKLYSALYRGLDKAEIVERSVSFKPRYREEVLAELHHCKAAGDKVYIVSASLDLWLEQIASRLGVELLCTTSSVDSRGRLDGRFASPNCHGAEKVRRLLEKESDRADYILTVYGDEPHGGDAALFAASDRHHTV